MRGEHVISAAVGAVIVDIARGVVVDVADSLILRFLTWLAQQIKAAFGGQQPGFGMA
jgi:hypothetical protein